MSVGSLSSTKVSTGLWAWLPAPAVKKDSCEVDNSLLDSRFHKIFLAAMAGLLVTYTVALALKSVAILQVGTFTTCLIFFTMIILDKRRADKAVLAKAVNEYLEKPFPSPLATRLMQTNISAVKSYLNQKGNPNKVNVVGNPLLSCHCNLDIYKLLLANEANVFCVNSIGSTCFREALENSKPDYLRSILATKRVKLEDFTNDQQVEFWESVGCGASGLLLKDYGFDPNIKNKEGYTALILLVKDASRKNCRGICWKDTEIIAKITTLLTCGADPKITVKVKKEVEEEQGEEGVVVNKVMVDRNAIEINTNPTIRNILEQALRH